MTLTKSLETAVQEREDRRDGIEWRVQRQRDALLVLTAQHAADGDRLPDTLARITRVTADTLGVARVSVWRYNTDRTGIDCVDLYDTSTDSHQSGANLRAADFPHYFRALAESDVVAVDDAIADARTAEFSEPYLRPLGIASMMDVPIHLGGAVIGVLCHEQTGTVRHWTDDEKSFAIAASTLVSLAFERFERRRAESALALQVAALNAVAHPVVIADRWANIAWVNPAFTALTGYSLDEAVGRNSIELLNAGRHSVEFFKGMWTALKGGGTWHGELWNRAKDGRLFLVDQTVTPVKDAAGNITHHVAIKVDLTEKKNLEAQLLQAQKMEVLGRLSGGIAHDFNNLLTVINGTAELALSELPDNSPLRTDFERIQESGNRASSLTRQLLAFSRKQIANRTPLVVGSILTGFRPMLQRLIGEDILLDVRDGSGPATVLADEGHLEQIILNLAINSRDAMPNGGVLRIESLVREIKPAMAGAPRNLTPGPHVVIRVTDTGEGMSPDIQAHIFEPFFTTKEQGKGTGLGLATVQAVVDQSGGAIAVSSRPNAGTTFTVYLPCGGEATTTQANHSAASEPSEPLRVLIVEDDAAVRDLAMYIFRSVGHQPTAAPDGTSALKALASGAVFDIIFTDIVLTDMSGRELAAHVMQRSPGTPVLFTSGYTDDAVLANSVRDNAAHFIAKPYTAPMVLDKVRDVIERSRRELSS
jgi:two-component system cell cycle sensor histidine kinase/response regulator CckA